MTITMTRGTSAVVTRKSTSTFWLLATANAMSSTAMSSATTVLTSYPRSGLAGFSRSAGRVWAAVPSRGGVVLIPLRIIRRG